MQRGVLVVAEIHSARFPQQPEQRVQVASHHSLKAFRLSRHNPRHVGMLADSTQLPGNVLGRQDEVDASRIHCIARHAVVLRRLLILGKSNSSRRFDGTATFGAVRSRTGQNHADGLLPGTFRQRTKKIIDRHVLPAHQYPRTQLQQPVLDGQVRVGGNHVGMVRLHQRALNDFGDGDLGCSRQDFPQRAAMFGVEVLHQHERHARLFRQVTQQFGECFQPARRGPNSHDGEGS